MGAAMYLQSVRKSEKHIQERGLQDFGVETHLQQDIQQWLQMSIGYTFNIETTIQSMRKSPSGVTPANLTNECRAPDKKLSLTQVLEWFAIRRLLPTLDAAKATVAKAAMGPTHQWLTMIPYRHTRLCLEPNIFLAAIRLRLGLPVTTRSAKCKFCKGGQVDKYGHHAVVCAGASSLVRRHNRLVDLIAQALESAGFSVTREHHGYLTDGRLPGDVAWHEDGFLHLLDLTCVESYSARASSIVK